MAAEDDVSHRQMDRRQRLAAITRTTQSRMAARAKWQGSSQL